MAKSFRILPKRVDEEDLEPPIMESEVEIEVKKEGNQGDRPSIQSGST